MEYLSTLNFNGLCIGLATFIIIGIFHPLVIKGEYYLGQKACYIFGFLGIIFILLTLLITNSTISALLGVTAFSCFWSIKEVKDQRERVRKGWFPANPKRKEAVSKQSN